MRSLLCLLLSGFSGLVWAQTDPGVRNAHNLIYHQEEKAVYLFGGATEKEVQGDLWKWSNGNWSLLSNSGPDPRTFAAMVYDAKNNQIILFGGSKVLFGKGPDQLNLLNDTWVFKQGSWETIVTETQPKPRAEAAYCYDSLRERFVLYGGYEIVGKQYVPLGDTWEFDGSDWQLVAEEGPTPRNNATLAYDPNGEEVILFGGSTGRSGYGDGLGETWAWDGQSWRKLQITQPPNIYNAAMVATDEGLMRYGGWNGKQRVMEMLRLTGNGWQEVETNPAPHHRNHHQMVYEAHQMRILLFGGHDGSTVFGDLWSYREGEWLKLGQSAPKARVRNGH